MLDREIAYAFLSWYSAVPFHEIQRSVRVCGWSGKEPLLDDGFDQKDKVPQKSNNNELIEKKKEEKG